MRWVPWLLVTFALAGAGLPAAIGLSDSPASDVTELYVQVITAIGTLLAATAAMAAALGSERTAERAAETAATAERAMALHSPPSVVVYSRLTVGRGEGRIDLVFARSDRELRDVTVTRVERDADSGAVRFRVQPAPFTLRPQTQGQEREIVLGEIPLEALRPAGPGIPIVDLRIDAVDGRFPSQSWFTELRMALLLDDQGHPDVMGGIDRGWQPAPAG